MRRQTRSKLTTSGAIACLCGSRQAVGQCTRCGPVRNQTSGNLMLAGGSEGARNLEALMLSDRACACGFVVGHAPNCKHAHGKHPDAPPPAAPVVERAFVVGDRVRCIDEGIAGNSVKQGQEYVVTKWWHHGIDCGSSVQLEGVTGGHYSRRFELIAPSSEGLRAGWKQEKSVTSERPRYKHVSGKLVYWVVLTKECGWTICDHNDPVHFGTDLNAALLRAEQIAAAGEGRAT